MKTHSFSLFFICIFLCLFPLYAQQYEATVTYIGKVLGDIPGYLSIENKTCADSKGNIWTYGYGSVYGKAMINHIIANKGFITSFTSEHYIHDFFYSPQNDEVFFIEKDGNDIRVLHLDPVKGAVLFGQFSAVHYDSFYPIHGTVMGDEIYIYCYPYLYYKNKNSDSINTLRLGIADIYDMQSSDHFIFLLEIHRPYPIEESTVKIISIDLLDTKIRNSIELDKGTSVDRIENYGTYLYAFYQWDFIKFERKTDGSLVKLETQSIPRIGIASQDQSILPFRIASQDQSLPRIGMPGQELFPNEKGFYVTTIKDGISGIFSYDLKNKTTTEVFHPKKKDDTILYQPSSLAAFKDEIYVLDYSEIKVFRDSKFIRKITLPNKSPGRITIDKNGTIFVFEYFSSYITMIKQNKITQYKGDMPSYLQITSNDSGMVYLQPSDKSAIVRFDPEKKKFKKLFDINYTWWTDIYAFDDGFFLSFSPDILRKYNNEGIVILERSCDETQWNSFTYSQALNAICIAGAGALVLLDPETFELKAKVPVQGLQRAPVIAADKSGAVYILKGNIVKIQVTTKNNLKK